MSAQIISRRVAWACALGAVTGFLIAGCKGKQQTNEAPTPKVVEVHDMNLVTVSDEDAKKFSLVPAQKFESYSELSATGSVSPDISREVPVISMANGRVVDVKTRLGDNVHKGQLLFRVQSPDITNAFDAYLKAVNDEHLANTAYVRAKDLFEHGAISQAMVDQAENSERDAKADLDAADQQLQTLGVDKQHPSSVVNVYSPVSGVIITQNITNSSAVGVSLSGSANAFTVADLSNVWVLCDVYENDLPKVKLGEQAKITLNAYPDQPLTGRISDIGPVLDPSLRTAKVRIEVKNPGFLKLGMFVTATFTGKGLETHVALPSDAVLHLHDRDWVFVPAGDNQFKRVEVRVGKMLPDKRQEILSGVNPGQQVVDQALLLENAGNQ